MTNQPEPSFENDFGKWIESNGVVLNPYLNDDGSFRADKIDLNQLKVGIVALYQADKEAAVREAAEWLLEQPSDIEGYTRDSNIRALIPHRWDLSATPISHPQAGEGEGK